MLSSVTASSRGLMRSSARVDKARMAITRWVSLYRIDSHLRTYGETPATVFYGRGVNVAACVHTAFLDQLYVQKFCSLDLVGIPMTKKKFAELELSLLHLQQNVEIPETHLIIHPVIQKAVEQVRVAIRALVIP
jgi:hypothetical protein